MFDFETYITTAATKLKAIGHSSTNKRVFLISGIASIEEVLKNITKIVVGNYYVMIEDGTSGRIIDLRSDNQLDRPLYAFYVFVKRANADSTGISSAKKNCKSIAMKIIARMRRDMNSERQLSNNSTGLRGFLPESITYYSVGPFGINYYGVRVQFENQEKNTDIIYSAADWNE